MYGSRSDSKFSKPDLHIRIRKNGTGFATLVYTLFVGESLPSIQLHFLPSPLLTDLPPRPPLLHQ